MRVIVVSHATASVFPPSCKLATDVIFSAAGLLAMVELWHRLKKGIFDPYCPELHYMRGPGPKWREKYADAGLIRSGVTSVNGEAAEQDLRQTLAAVALRCAGPRPACSRTLGGSI
jgi:hypothetical protein